MLSFLRRVDIKSVIVVGLIMNGESSTGTGEASNLKLEDGERVQ